MGVLSSDFVGYQVLMFLSKWDLIGELVAERCYETGNSEIMESDINRNSRGENLKTGLTLTRAKASDLQMYLYFETERLVVRQYKLNDIDGLILIMSDSRVHTYTKDRNNPWDKQRTEAYIKYMMDKDFRTLDCFHGAVIEKKTSQLIGLCGLNPYKTDEPEIEFKLGVPYWGRGYATELGRKMIKEAFASTAIKGIYGMAQPENIASRKVLEKIGMKYVGNQIFRNHEDSFYYIANLDGQNVRKEI